ncbi:MAG: DUF2164 domain-containing protein [Gemmatimonadaceae bacterium]
MRPNTPIHLSDDARKRALASIRRYLSENLDEEIGDLKAALFLDYVLAEFGPTIYNKAIADARAFFIERAGDLDAVAYHAEFPFWSKARAAERGSTGAATA